MSLKYSSFFFRCASLWLHCLDSSDPEIYLNFSTRIHLLLLKGSNSDIEDVIIERLKEVQERINEEETRIDEALCKCIKNLSYVQSTSRNFQRNLFDLAFDLMTETKTHVNAFMIMSKEMKNLMLVNLKHSAMKLAQKMTVKNPKELIHDVMLAYNYDNISKFLERQLPLLMTNLVFLACQENLSKFILQFFIKLQYFKGSKMN